jgi:hypothetical protein
MPTMPAAARRAALWVTMSQILTTSLLVFRGADWIWNSSDENMRNQVDVRTSMGLMPEQAH